MKLKLMKLKVMKAVREGRLARPSRTAPLAGNEEKFRL
jgi:hypothetical protein